MLLAACTPYMAPYIVYFHSCLLTRTFPPWVDHRLLSYRHSAQGATFGFLFFTLCVRSNNVLVNIIRGFEPRLMDETCISGPYSECCDKGCVCCLVRCVLWLYSALSGAHWLPLCVDILWTSSSLKTFWGAIITFQASQLPLWGYFPVFSTCVFPPSLMVLRKG